MRELVAEICRERGSSPCDCKQSPGLTPAEAGVLSDLLLRCYGQSPEYPFWWEGDACDPAGRREIEPLEHLAQAMARGHQSPGERVGAEPLLRILHVLVKIGAISSNTAAGLGEQLTPAPTHLARRPPGQPPAYLLPVISGLLVAANLTERQDQIARRLLHGASTAQVVRELGIALATVRVIWGQARRRLRRALVQMVLDRAERERARRISRAQMQEVLRREQARMGYQRPKHCPRGKERCAECGYCPFALALLELAR